MGCFQIIRIVVLGGIFIFGAVSLGLAGENNIVVISQEGDGNTLSANQFSAVNSSIGGVEVGGNGHLDQTPLLPNITKLNQSLAPSMPARQLGNANEAMVNVESSGGAVYLLQDNRVAGLLAVGNRADVLMTGDDAFAAVSQQNGDNNLATVKVFGQSSTGVIIQGGSTAFPQITNNNEATVIVTGNFASGTILQDGSGNIGSVEVTSSGTAGTLVQNGNGNEIALQVTGISGGSVTYTFNGDNSTAAIPIVVITNGASVSITQTR